jgi:hypothetical protein
LTVFESSRNSFAFTKTREVFLPEHAFRYVSLSRVKAYKLLGWSKIGETLSPHDGNICAVMEWSNSEAPVEPPGGACATSRAAMC